MVNEWDDAASGWDDDPAVRLYAKSAMKSLLQLDTIDLSTSKVLDFGCGTGALSELLSVEGAQVTAVDTSEAMVEVLQAKLDSGALANVTATTHMPEPGERFDLVACASVCAFLDDYPAKASQLVALLKPDGIFVQWDWERTAADDFGLTRAEIQDALRAAGLADVEVKTAFKVQVESQTMAPLMGVGYRRDDN